MPGFIIITIIIIIIIIIIITIIIIAKGDMIEASGSLKTICRPNVWKRGCYTCYAYDFEADDTDAVLLIDAFYAFNALNSATALHNIRVDCPVIALYVINSYQKSACLSITGGKEILSAEGTTQGDPFAMGLFALSVQLWITNLGAASSTKQYWLVDDACGTGSILEIKKL